MAQPQLTAEDIIEDIEFELLQGAISQNDIGQAIEMVRQFQSRLRSQAFPSARGMADMRDVISRQFQVNDMLITLLQEMSAALRSQERDTRRLSYAVTRRLPGALDQEPAEEELAAEAARSAARSGGGPPPISVAAGTASDLVLGAVPADIAKAMSDDSLHLPLEARPVGLPVVGGVLGRVRRALHSISLFYAQRLGEKQGTINRTYGDWILRLAAERQQQQAEIEALTSQLAALRGYNHSAGDAPATDPG